MALGYRTGQRQSSSFDRHSPEKDLSFPRTGLLRKKGLRIIRRIFRIHPGAFSDPLSHAIIANQLPSTVRFTAGREHICHLFNTSLFAFSLLHTITAAFGLPHGFRLTHQSGNLRCETHLYAVVSNHIPIK